MFLQFLIVLWKYSYLIVYLSIYLGCFSQLGGSRQHKRNKQKQWGFHSVLPAMTRDPAEFGWHCWSNTTHPLCCSSSAIQIDCTIIIFCNYSYFIISFPPYYFLTDPQLAADLIFGTLTLNHGILLLYECINDWPFVYFKDTGNLFIHIARIPIGDSPKVHPNIFKMSPPFGSSEGYSASGVRYQSDGVQDTHLLPHS